MAADTIGYYSQSNTGKVLPIIYHTYTDSDSLKNKMAVEVRAMYGGFQGIPVCVIDRVKINNEYYLINGDLDQQFGNPIWGKHILQRLKESENSAPLFFDVKSDYSTSLKKIYVDVKATFVKNSERGKLHIYLLEDSLVIAFSGFFPQGYVFNNTFRDYLTPLSGDSTFIPEGKIPAMGDIYSKKYYFDLTASFYKYNWKNMRCIVFYSKPGPDNNSFEVLNAANSKITIDQVSIHKEIAGIKQLKSVKDVKIYQNNYHNNYTIEFEVTQRHDLTIEIYTLAGKHIYAINTRNYLPGKYKEFLNKQLLIAGSYIISIKSNIACVTKKFPVQN